MRRRAFLVGAAAAGVGIGARARWARASEPALVTFFEEARRDGKPMLVATLMSSDDHATFQQARHAVEHGGDRDLAVRFLLVQLCETDDTEAVRLLTNERARIGPPSLALVDGTPARLVKEVKLARGLGPFLRDTVPLTAAWLRPRVAEISRHRRDSVDTLRRRMANGELPGGLGAQLPAVVALEALRRKGVPRDTLLGDLVTASAMEPSSPSRNRDLPVDQCGMAMKLLTPLGLRFADLFTKPDREREPKT